MRSISRRRFLRSAASAGATAIAAPTMLSALSARVLAQEGSISPAGGRITWAANGGDTQEAMRVAWTEPFTAETGIEVVHAGPVDYGRVRVQVESQQIEWDVFESEGFFVPQGGAEGLLEEIDYSTGFEAEEDLAFPSWRKQFGVGTWGFATVIAFDPALHTDHPSTWAEFFDTQQFPGKRGFFKSPFSNIFEAALIADGVAPEALYPLDFDRAFAKMDSIKQDLVFWESGAQSQQYLTSGAVDFNAMWNGRVYQLAKRGASAAIDWTQNFQSAQYLAIPRGSANVAAATQAIAYTHRPDAQARFADLTSYSPANKQAVDLISEEVRPWIATTPEHLTGATRIDDDFWATEMEGIQPRWQAWLLS